MARVDTQQGLTPSIIDRLIDPESEGTSWRRGYGIEQMMDAVRRDLESLLNTRQPEPTVPREFVETSDSVLGYGVPDLVAISTTGPEFKQLISRAIEESIERFEPRLRDIRVAQLEEGGGQAMKLQLQITAQFCVEPSPEVSFMTILKLTTGQTSIELDGG